MKSVKFSQFRVFCSLRVNPAQPRFSEVNQNYFPSNKMVSKFVFGIFGIMNDSN